MAKENLKFWFTCQNCKSKIGIAPGLIFKYLDRLLENMRVELKAGTKRVWFQKQVAPPENLPVEEQ